MPISASAVVKRRTVVDKVYKFQLVSGSLIATKLALNLRYCSKAVSTLASTLKRPPGKY